MKDLTTQEHAYVRYNIIDSIIFYVIEPETGKHVAVLGKQKNVKVENVEDNDEGRGHQSVQRNATIHQSNEHQTHR
jgi:hypothetical protein